MCCVNPATLVAFFAVTLGASVPALPVPATNVIIRVLSVQQKLSYEGRTDCLYLANLKYFVVQGTDQAVGQFCILMYKKASDCKERPLSYDYLMTDLSLAHNFPAVQAIKQCPTILQE